jgi:hypothetical protein
MTIKLTQVATESQTPKFHFDVQYQGDLTLSPNALAHIITNNKTFNLLVDTAELHDIDHYSLTEWTEEEGINYEPTNDPYSGTVACLTVIVKSSDVPIIGDTSYFLSCDIKYVVLSNKQSQQ